MNPRLTVLAAAIVAVATLATAAEAGAADRAAAQASFGFRLLQALDAEQSSPNLLASPASLAATLAFLDLGADAGMRAALAKTLGYDAGEGAAKLAALRADAKAMGLVPAGWGPLTFANAIFVDPTARMFPEALAGLTDAGMTAEVTDLNRPSGLAAINEWVSEQTAGFIPTILDEPLDNAAFVALNALRFKDDWANEFDPDNTSQQPFRLHGGATVDVDMMSRHPTTLKFRGDDRFMAAVLPYKTAGFSMIVLTTKDRPAALGDFAGVAEWLSGDSFAEASVILAMPKFETAITAHLLPALDAMGLKAGESPTAFEGFSKTPLVIADVIQKTRVAVNEVGTEAAAATAIVGRAGARPDNDVVVLRLDRPFLFAIREEATGLILLTGYVGNPSED